jgi:thiamine-phosphate pyrophosphorylase
MPLSPSAREIIRGLYAIVDTTYVKPVDVEKTAGALIRGGARVIQLRAKDSSAADVITAAAAIRALTLKNGVAFIINDRIDIAILSGADGVHLGQDDIPLEDCRRLLGSSAIVGISTHDLDEARKAASGGADYISFGPVFATVTKKDAAPPRGIEGLRELVREVTLPIVAIGGITEENVEEVLSAGADSVAIISDILTAHDISERTASIISKIDRCSKSSRDK